jgi:uncharacterized protein
MPGSRRGADPVTVVDCCVHNRWSSASELAAYLSPGWREYVGRPGLFPGGRGMAPLVPPAGWSHPDSDWLPDAPGADPAALEAALAERGVERAVLVPVQGLVAGALPHAAYSLDLVRAVNDWTRERWLSSPGRLHGLVLAPAQLPDEAVREIRRVGTHPRIAGVLLAGSGQGRPFGHPGYHPIYAAAAELGLPVVIHTGSEAPPNTASQPTAGGLPSTFAEYYALRAQPVMTHLMSLISQGVLDRHPDLRVVAIGAGVAWLPGWLWRFDADFRSYAAREAPWMRRFPSEQVREQVRVTTYSFGAIRDREGFRRLLGAADWLADTLCYAGGFPSWDADAPDAVAAAFPDAWRRRVLGENALAAFRWPST